MASTTADQKIEHCSTTCNITTEWYGKFCQLAAANAKDRNNNLRFDYGTLKKARDAGALHMDDQIPLTVVELFRNVYNTTVKMAGPIELNDRTENVLLQVLLNIQVGYQLATGDILFTTFSEG